MNKKLLFGIMSLAALTACTSDDFESQEVAQKVSPIQFEVINNNAETRASMNGNKIEWNANDGDLFTLYYGGAVAGTPLHLSGCQNATYTASQSEGKAILTTPSMIKQGSAIMVWPVDTTFFVQAGNVSIKIPAEQTNIENNIPYVSDVINIGGYNAGAPYNTAGLNRPYPVYMRPMASQLTIKADYANTDATLASLYTGDDPIDPISVSSVDLLTTPGGGGDDFTTVIPLQFTAAAPADLARWNTTAATKVANNAWTHVTGFGAATASVDKLTSKVLAANNEGCKFLILPQTAIAGGVDDGAVVVNTIYGKVVVATPGTAGTLYTAAEAADAWYRYISAASKAAGAGAGYDATETPAATAESNGTFKTTSAIENGMMQTINAFSTYTHQGTSTVQTEPEGTAATRYVKVLLTHLDMTDLHVTSDKQLRDAARVWQTMNLTDVTVFLDGDSKNEFKISQKTIETINAINAAVPGGTKSFKVKPCQTAHPKKCNTIVITGGGDVPNIPFIEPNGLYQANVELNAGQTWNWKGTVTVQDAGVNTIINRGTMVNDATATLKTAEPNGTQNNIPFENKGTWNVTAGTINVEFDVTNNGIVTIAKGAQYRQDGQHQNTQFINDATNKPSRFKNPDGDDTAIGTVWNNGVFATVAAAGKTATIDNYGLIEHADADAKTYITTNENGGTGFGTAFGPTNKIGRINLPYSNKNEDNVSVSAALNTGFISVTVDGEVSGALNASVVGSKVNYVIVKSGVTEIQAVAAQVRYLEINQPGTELAWNVPTTTVYDGLMVLSDVNIKLGTKIIATTTYLGADMYVGGKFNVVGIAAELGDPDYAATNFSGYYGNTSGNVSSKYITY